MDIVSPIWRAEGLPEHALQQLELDAGPACLPSSFGVGVAAQGSVALAASAGATLHAQRTSTDIQPVRVPLQAAERECTGLYRLNEHTPATWAPFSGLYPTADGHIRVHANFDHHRDGVLKILDLDPAHASPDELAIRLSSWRAAAFEEAAMGDGLAVAMARDFATWDRHPHAIWSHQQPLYRLHRLDDSEPRTLPDLNRNDRPLTGLKVLDLTRILAGPICGRTLAAYGADVLLINAPHLPNISAIVDTSRGKRSALLDLRKREDAAQMRKLLKDAHVFVQGYRPGGLAALGLGPQQAAQLRPGIVYVSLSAYGWGGAWESRRGFDSLVQTVAGFNLAEAAASGAQKPTSLPIPILDFASGFLMAYAAQAALYKQQTEGGSWHAEISLLQTANWLRSLGQDADGLQNRAERLSSYLQSYPCTEGELLGMSHAAEFDHTPARWSVPSAPPGSCPAQW
ncbi:MAG: CoA transferase [Pseudomonadota bacterium]